MIAAREKRDTARRRPGFKSRLRRDGAFPGDAVVSEGRTYTRSRCWEPIGGTPRERRGGGRYQIPAVAADTNFR